MGPDDWPHYQGLLGTEIMDHLLLVHDLCDVEAKVSLSGLPSDRVAGGLLGGRFVRELLEAVTMILGFPNDDLLGIERGDGCVTNRAMHALTSFINFTCCECRLQLEHVDSGVLPQRCSAHCLNGS